MKACPTCGKPMGVEGDDEGLSIADKSESGITLQPISPGRGDDNNVPTMGGDQPAKAEAQDRPPSNESRDPHKSVFQRIGESLKLIRTVVTTGLMLLFVTTLSYFAYLEFKRDPIVIEAIQVPQELVDQGYTSEVIAKRFNDAMFDVYSILNAGGDRVGKKGRLDHGGEEGSELERPGKPSDVRPLTTDDFELPGIGISLQTAIRVVKAYLEIPQARIGGEITSTEGKLSFRPRIEGRVTATPHPISEDDELDKLLSTAAGKVIVAYVSKKHDLADSAAFENWGNSLHRQRHYVGASEMYAHATKLSPSNVRAYNNWGVALVKQGDYQGAMEKFEKATEIKKGYGKALSNWGWALAKAGYYDKAVEKYRQCVEGEPRNHDAYNDWGNALRQWGNELRRQGKGQQASDKYESALAKHDEAWKLAPKNVGIYVNWGLTLAASGDYLAAIAKYQEALVIDSQHFKANYNLAVALQEQGRYDDAINAVRQALITKPKYAIAYSAWGAALVGKSAYREALGKFERGMQLNPQEVDYYSWGEALGALGKSCEARKKYQMAVEKADLKSIVAQERMDKLKCIPVEQGP